jgi:hypothetical protein
MASSREFRIIPADGGGVTNVSHQDVREVVVV